MCALKSCGMSAVCTWGLRGIFFLTKLFVLFYHGAVCFLCESFFLSMYILYNSPLSYVHHTVLFSNTPDFMFN